MTNREIGEHLMKAILHPASTWDATADSWRADPKYDPIGWITRALDEAEERGSNARLVEALKEYERGIRVGMERAADMVEDAAHAYDILLQSPYSCATKDPEKDDVRMSVLYQMESEIRAEAKGGGK